MLVGRRVNDWLAAVISGIGGAGLLKAVEKIFFAGRQMEKFALKKDLDYYVKKPDLDVIEKKLDKIEERQAEDRRMNAENHRQLIDLISRGD